MAEEASEAVAAAARERQAALARRNELRSETENLERAPGEAAARFDPTMPRLLSAIERAPWPSGTRPVGTIGLHIALKPSQ